MDEQQQLVRPTQPTERGEAAIWIRRPLLGVCLTVTLCWSFTVHVCFCVCVQCVRRAVCSPLLPPSLSVRPMDTAAADAAAGARPPAAPSVPTSLSSQAHLFAFHSPCLFVG